MPCSPCAGTACSFIGRRFKARPYPPFAKWHPNPFQTPLKVRIKQWAVLRLRSGTALLLPSVVSLTPPKKIPGLWGTGEMTTRRMSRGLTLPGRRELFRAKIMGTHLMRHHFAYSLNTGMRYTIVFPLKNSLSGYIKCSRGF